MRQSSLKLVSYSHRFGSSVQQVAFQNGSRRGDVRDEDILDWARQLEHRSRLFQPECHDGDAIFFDGRMWHASHNTLDRTRLALLLQYASPATRIRIPKSERFDWPFQFLEQPRPGCLMLKGTDHYRLNRLVKSLPEQHNAAVPLTSQVRTLDLPLAEDKDRGWKPYHVFRGPACSVADLSCHVSVLSPGHSPHELHNHLEEEILMVLDGEAEVQVEGADGEERHRLTRGSFTYYPAGQSHTLNNPTKRCVTYLMFKWLSDSAEGENCLVTSVLPGFEDQSHGEVRLVTDDFAPRIVLTGSSAHLKKLQAHVTTLQPGAGYPAHADAYDVAIVTHQGTVETLGQHVGPHSVIFYASGEPHGMRNVGREPAVYTVFEFHGLHPARPAHRVRVARRWRPTMDLIRRMFSRTTRRRAS